MKHAPSCVMTRHRRGSLLAFGSTGNGIQEAANFQKRTNRIIKLITVREILDDEHAQRMQGAARAGPDAAHASPDGADYTDDGAERMGDGADCRPDIGAITPPGGLSGAKLRAGPEPRVGRPVPPPA